MGVGAQRAVAVVVLLVAGILSLPLAAAVFDGEGSENWIIPAQVVGMLVAGALVGAALPGLAGAGATRSRGVRIGMVYAVGAAAVGVLLFWVLLNGFDGA
jgi:hypothetical protein